MVDLEAGPIPAQAARRLVCDSGLTPIVLDGHGRLTAMGQRTRVVSAALRRALDHRHSHCTHPGCDVRAR